MKTYVALLRAVNVGGTGKLAMADLRDLCRSLGWRDVRTYIASGNVVFESDDGEAQLKAALGSALQAKAGKPVGVVVRSAAQMGAALQANPFKTAAPDRVMAIFLDAAPPADLLAGVTGRMREEIAPGLREIYVHYVDGQADTKLKIAAAKLGTARNINTVAKLAALAT